MPLRASVYFSTSSSYPSALNCTADLNGFSHRSSSLSSCSSLVFDVRRSVPIAKLLIRCRPKTGCIALPTSASFVVIGYAVGRTKLVDDEVIIVCPGCGPNLCAVKRTDGPGYSPKQHWDNSSQLIDYHRMVTILNVAFLLTTTFVRADGLCLPEDPRSRPASWRNDPIGDFTLMITVSATGLFRPNRHHDGRFLCSTDFNDMVVGTQGTHRIHFATAIDLCQKQQGQSVADVPHPDRSSSLESLHLWPEGSLSVCLHQYSGPIRRAKNLVCMKSPPSCSGRHFPPWM